LLLLLLLLLLQPQTEMRNQRGGPLVLIMSEPGGSRAEAKERARLALLWKVLFALRALGASG